jgi:hypothetical protein
MNSALQPLRSAIPVLEHAFRVTLRDGGRVGVHSVEQDLHRRLLPALQVAANS